MNDDLSAYAVELTIWREKMQAFYAAANPLEKSNMDSLCWLHSGIEFLANSSRGNLDAKDVFDLEGTTSSLEKMYMDNVAKIRNSAAFQNLSSENRGVILDYLRVVFDEHLEE